MHELCVFTGPAIAAYAFGANHPFGPRRHDAFTAELDHSGLAARVSRCEPVRASDEEILWFHTRDHLERVKELSIAGEGWLDGGDTPAFSRMYEASAAVVGATLEAVRRVMAGTCRRAFIPIAGLHHARPERAAGFCVFNDCGIAIEALRRVHGIRRVAYVDIDAHHGDGVFYAYEADPDLALVDLHEDGRFLYPGTGGARETGRGPGAGTKLNIPMPMGAGDAEFRRAWAAAAAFLEAARPEFILFQCGADSIGGDPLTHLQYTAGSHAHAAASLREIADRHAQGRLVAMGGGGYDLDNLAQAWCAVVRALA